MTDTKLNFVNALDSRLRVLLTVGSQKLKYSLLISPQNVTYYQQSANTSTTSGSSYSFNVSRDQIFGACMWEEIGWKVTVTAKIPVAVGINVNVLANGYMAPRCFPATSNTNTSKLTLNGTSVSIANVGDIIPALLAFNKCPEFNNSDFSCMAPQLDCFAELNDANETLNENKFGALKSPLNSFFSSTYDNNGNINSVQVNEIDGRVAPFTNVDTLRIFRFTTRESIFSGITSLNESIPTAGFCGINTVQYQRTYNTILDSINEFYVDALANGNSKANYTFKVELDGQPRLFYTLITPPPEYPLPNYTEYKYIDYSQFSQTDCPSIVAPYTIGNKQQSTSMSLSYVPKCIYVWVANKKAGNRTAFDSTAPGYKITNLNVNYGNRSGMFAEMTDYQLYSNFCARANFVKGFGETGLLLIPDNDIAGSATGLKCGGFGNILRIDCTDLVGYGDLSPGCIFNAQLQVTVTYDSLINSAAIPNNSTPVLNVLVVQEGIMVNDNGQISTHLELISSQDIKEVRKQTVDLIEHSPALGAGLFGDIVKHGINLASNPNVQNALKKFANKGLEHIKSKYGGRRHHSSKHSKHSKGGKRHHRRIRGGAIENDENESLSECDSNCSCSEYSSGEEEIIEPKKNTKKGGSIMSKSEINRRIKFL